MKLLLVFFAVVAMCAANPAPKPELLYGAPIVSPLLHPIEDSIEGAKEKMDFLAKTGFIGGIPYPYYYYPRSYVWPHASVAPVVTTVV